MNCQYSRDDIFNINPEVGLSTILFFKFLVARVETGMENYLVHLFIIEWKAHLIESNKVRWDE